MFLGVGDRASMPKIIENILYNKASLCFECLRMAKQMFEEFLKEESGAGMPVYYKARNYLRDGEKFYQEAISEAKKLLSPLSQYSSPDFEKWREEHLSKNRVLAESQELVALQAELIRDAQLSLWLSKEDIQSLIAKNFATQQTGKRKLANIKVRIIVDKLKELLFDAQQLRKRAMEKCQLKGE